MRIGWKIPLALLIVAVAGGWLAADRRSRERLVSTWDLVTGGAKSKQPLPSKEWVDGLRDSLGQPPPTGWLELSEAQIKGVGLKTIAVKEHAEPIILRLPGITDYDPATLTLVRPVLDCRIEKVLVNVGTAVKVDDPLLEVFSTELAQARSDYETAVSQWTRDKKVLDYKAPLAQSETIPRKELIEIENDEAKSRLQMKLARDKLLIYGLTDKEIDATPGDGIDKARMTLRSRAEGVVIKRTVVAGNYYDAKDELMQIAPLDHLLVRGSVSELDADKVEVGQTLHVVFPYSDQTLAARVAYIDKAIDPGTRAASFRALIPNPDQRFKAGMFVRILLEIPPTTGETIVPRESVVSVDRLFFVFVKKPGTDGQFERRKIFVGRESSDWVIVAPPTDEHRGLAAGEEVATTASLILEQMYETQLVASGATSHERPRDDEVFGKPSRPVNIKTR